MRVRLLATLVLAFACVSGLFGQQQPSTPTFRAGVDLVEVDVNVTDATGAPVSDLTAQDFEIFEDGRQQSIATLAFVDVGAKDLPRTALLAEPDVQSNTRGDGRTYVIAFDEVAPEHTLRARLFLRRFIEQYFAPNDVGAVVLLGRGRARDTQDFTSNPRLLTEAIDRYQGGFGKEDAPVSLAPPSAPSSLPREATSLPILLPSPTADTSGTSRSRASALKALAEFMGGMGGRRKTLLYVSTGISFDMFEIIGFRGGAMSLAMADVWSAMTAATRGNVTIYAIDPMGLSPDGALADRATAFTSDERDERRDARTNLRTFAELTGGFAFTDQNNIDAAFTRIVRENSSYYVLGFNSTNPRRDTRFRNLDVRVKRAEVQIKARKGYIAAPPKEERTNARLSRDLAPAVASAIASPLRTADLPMRVTAVPYKGSGRNADVLLVVDVDATRLPLVEQNGVQTADVDLAWVAISADGRTRPNGRYRTALALKPDTYDRASRNGFRFVSAIDVPPGRYQLRVAAGGTTGPAGSVVYDLEVPDFSRTPLAISGLSLTSRLSADAVIQQIRNPLQGRLAATPTTAREFDKGDVLTLFTEVYTDGKRSPAHAIDMKASIVNADGRSVSSAEQQASSSDARATGGRLPFTTTLPINDAAPGDYVLRVEARESLAGGATAVRNIPIRVR
jgi:VWFA-related protein